MKLDKTEIARRQLGTALALFLQDCDPVSVHALACAGCEIAEHLTRKAGEEPFSTHALLTFPDLDIGKIRRLKNQYWNAFKHAQMRDGIEREDSELLERFGDEVNDHTLYIGWHDYMLAVGILPIEAQIFEAWYFALYLEKLNPERSRLDRRMSASSRSTLSISAMALAQSDSSRLVRPRGCSAGMFDLSS